GRAVSGATALNAHRNFRETRNHFGRADDHMHRIRPGLALEEDIRAADVGMGGAREKIEDEDEKEDEDDSRRVHRRTFVMPLPSQSPRREATMETNSATSNPRTVKGGCRWGFVSLQNFARQSPKCSA